MAILIRTSVMRHCALALLLVALTAAVCIAQTNPGETDPDVQYPVVDCPATQTNCNTCRQYNAMVICLDCADGYSTSFPAGTCEVYNGQCSAVSCAKCASNNPALCVTCSSGYTYQLSSLSCTADSTPPTTVDSSSSAPASPPTPETPAEPPTTGDSSSSTPVLPTTTQPPTTTAAPCLAPQCAVCSSGSSTVCVACNAGYTLMNYGACKPTGSCAVANCRQCFSDHDGFCATCRSGYRSTVAGACRRRNGAAYTHPTALVAIVMALVAYAATML